VVVVDASVIPADQIRPLKRVEYDRLVATGAFVDERVELIDGLLVRMSPQGADHAYVLRRLPWLLKQAVGARADVQVQCPLAVASDTELEPDVAVVPPGDYLDDHPDRALLVVEVADSTLRKDRLVKAQLYAGMKVPEYWIVNLEAGVVEVHLAPGPDGYASRATVDREGELRPVALAGVVLRAADFLPPRRR
jgi:Uma2 family endonuclease